MPDAAGGAAGRVRLAAAIILAAGVLAYWNGLTGEYVGYNAVRSLRDNADLDAWWPPQRALGLHLSGIAALADGGTLVRRPVLHFSFVLSHALPGGDSAARHQMVNIAIHLGAALLLFGAVRRTLLLPRWSDAWSTDATPVAAAAAALWVAHPLHTESVTYVIQRAESLAGFFALAALYATARAAGAAEGRRWRIAAIAFCLLGLGSKESVAALPVALWLYDGILVRGSLRASLVRQPRFFLALAATWALPAWMVIRTWEDVMIDFQSGRMAAYFAAQPRVLLEYVALFVWPNPLYVYTNTQRFADLPGVVLGLSAAVVALALAATACGLRRGRPSAFLAAAAFLALAPTSLIATNDMIQEHRTYLPAAAAAVGAVLLIHMGLRRRVRSQAQATALLLGLVAPVVVASALLAQQRNLAYGEEFAAFYPGDLAMAHGTLARHAAAQFRPAEAQARYEAMFDLPESAFGRGDLDRRFHRGRLHNDYGALLFELGEREAASEHFAHAEAVGGTGGAGTNNAAVLDALAGDVAAARNRLEPLQPRTRMIALRDNNLGVVRALAGDRSGAEAALQRAIAAIPTFQIARANLEALDAPTYRVSSLRPSGYDDPWLLLRLERTDAADRATEDRQP